MTAEVLLEIQRQVRDARAVLTDGDPAQAKIEGVLLLRQAEDAAGDLPSDLAVDSVTFRAVLDVRNELGGCLLAAERMEEAGVESRVVAGILGRGAATAEVIIGRVAAGSVRG
jgi:hypothetical protein